MFAWLMLRAVRTDPHACATRLLASHIRHAWLGDAGRWPEAETPGERVSKTWPRGRQVLALFRTILHQGAPPD